jgi:Tol biopolymer transport system component/tRNA A-37 threonylcarbamoyl transferase component Bud32
MTIGPGTRLGCYEISAKLGEGGMGEVYRATDTKLKRDVAIKVLPEGFTADAERLARFEREAQLLAQLHHPNIASIFGLEESAGACALVMELVDGPTLAERLERGPLPLHEALSVSLQIAQALEEAHEKGIVHRDLKPQNIKAPLDGKVKVLDFGLAKAMDSTVGNAASASQLAKSPTLTLRQTVQGMILGTAAYMAPEQAAGGVTDRRADIWSFGVVLFEMLAGRRLFEGETVSHVLAGVLKEEPDFSCLPADTPPRIVRLLRRCLRKKPRERLQAIGDARVVIDEVLAGEVDEAASTTAMAPVPRRRPAWQVALALIAAVAVGAMAAVALLGWNEPATPAPRTLSELPSPDGMEIFYPALSPDGAFLALSARSASTTPLQIWLRNLATGDMRPVPGTENGVRPFWSPDGRALGYLDTGDYWLKRIDLEGGRSVRLAQVGPGRTCGASWGAMDIVFCDPSKAPLHRVSPSGGDRSELTRPGAGEGHVAPWFLRDGKRFLYLGYKEAGGLTVRLGSVGGGADDQDLVPTDMQSVVSGGRLYYGRGTTLLARGFDEATGKLSPEEAEIVVEGVDGSVWGQFTVAARLLVFLPPPESRGSRVTIYDREGKAVDTIDADSFLDDLTLSPDGRLAAVMKVSGESGAGAASSDVWRIDLEREILDRVTYGESDDDPVFSPDGSQIAFAHAGDLFVKPANGSGEPRLLAKKIGDIVTNDWAPDGQILYSDIEGSGEDLFAIAADGGEPRRVTKTPFNERNAVVSPDGRWLAYASDESGDMQVYLTVWPSLDGKWRVSSDKAAMPRWRHDGRELFFLAHDQHLMSATVEADGRAPRLGLPRRLFAVQKQVFYLARTSRWAVMPRGDRFLVLEPLADADAPRRLMLLAPLDGDVF